MAAWSEQTNGKRVSIDSWWLRAGGGREVLRVSAPLVVSSLSWTIMTFVDRVMLNWVSGVAMAAAFTSSAAWFAMLSLPLGLCSFTNTFVAQYDGAGQRYQIGRVFWQAVWVALGFAPLILLAIPLAPAFFALGRHSADAYHGEVVFFQILCLGGPALVLAQSGSAFYSGRGQTWVVMLVDTAAAVLNLALDYCWIFGNFGFPAWGVAGAASATAVSMWAKAIVYLLLPLQRKYRDQFGMLRGMGIDWKVIRRILYYGGPSGLQMLLDVAGFTAFIIFVGRIGTVQVEATSMAFSVSSLAFMPIYGLHLGASVLVGEHLGENRDDRAARATYTTLQIAWIYMLGISLMYAFLPGLFLHGFFIRGGANVDSKLAVEQMAAMLLRFVAAYNLLDATQMVFVGALKGAGDTRFLLRVSLLMTALLAGFSWLSVEIWRLNIYGCWILIVIWCCLAATIYALRFWQGKWRRMRVIEATKKNHELDAAPALSGDSSAHG
jgi:multidrug resistance protein, MATE family